VIQFHALHKRTRDDPEAASRHEVTIEVIGDVARVLLWGGDEQYVFIYAGGSRHSSITTVHTSTADDSPTITVYPLDEIETDDDTGGFLRYIIEFLKRELADANLDMLIDHPHFKGVGVEVNSGKRA
jgi:hypothetical protein